jgi:RND family efflux transporter MFP subunit
MTSPRHSKRPPRTALLALAIAIGLSTAGILAARTPERPRALPSTSPALAVSVIAIAHTDGYALRRIFTGRVEARRSSSLGFERGGLLEAVLIREGEPVIAGQVVARLDDTLLQAQRKELEAALADAEARLSLAEVTLRRYRESVNRGAVTGQALDEAREGARAARAGADLARARIASVDAELAKAELRAPFDGVVTRRLADEGQVLAAGSPVVELQEQAPPEVRVGVAGTLADTLRPGTEYRLAWRGQGFPARLRAVLPVRELGTRTVDALFVPMEPPAGLRPGELVELELSDWVAQPGAWLPLSALAEGSRGLWNVYAAEPLSEASSAAPRADHRIAPRPVEVLYQESDRVFVRGALQRGEQIVPIGLHRVVPGQRVRALATGPEQLAMGER